MLIVGKLWINMNLIFVLTDPTKPTSFRNIFFLSPLSKSAPNTIYLTFPANFLVRNIKFNVHISIIILIMIKILSFVFWKTGHFLLHRPLCTKQWRSTARGCGQQIEGHESFLVTSALWQSITKHGFSNLTLHEMEFNLSNFNILLHQDHELQSIDFESNANLFVNQDNTNTFLL